MDSLEGIGRAEANPYVLTRIRARMDADRKAVLPVQWRWRLATIMVVFVLLNLLTIGFFNRKEQESQGTEAIAKEYAISLPDSY